MLSPDFIKDYICAKFSSNYRIVSSGREIIAESPFLDSDPNRHLSVNVQTGIWICNKTRKGGNFFSLYAHLEKISYHQAEFDLTLKMLYSGDIEHSYEYAKDSFITSTPIFDTKDWLPLNDSAWHYFLGDRPYYTVPSFSKRKLLSSTQQFFYCTKGKFKDRVIIPFMEKGEILFFQARSTEEIPKKPKYLNAENAKSSHVLFPYKKDFTGPLYITEGPINAISIQMHGFNATSTQTCKVSKVQMEMLKTYPGALVIAYDNDKPGREGAKHFRKVALQSGICPEKIMCSFPLKGEDWNDLHVRKSEEGFIYGLHYERFDYFFKIKEELNEL